MRVHGVESCPNCLSGLDIGIEDFSKCIVCKGRGYASDCGCTIAEDGAIVLCAWHEAALPYEVWSRKSPPEGQRPIRLRSGRLV